MHGLLERGTILVGLVEELRPLMQPLGGALGDLCAGFGNAEASEQALETAFMIRASAEMLELHDLSVVGHLLEELTPLLNGAPPEALRDGRACVAALMTALEESMEQLAKGEERPVATLDAAREGMERLRQLRTRQVQQAPAAPIDLEAMLATLPATLTITSAPEAEEAPEILAPIEDPVASASAITPLGEPEPTPAGGEVGSMLESWPAEDRTLESPPAHPVIENAGPSVPGEAPGSPWPEPVPAAEFESLQRLDEPTRHSEALHYEPSPTPESPRKARPEIRDYGITPNGAEPPGLFAEFLSRVRARTVVDEAAGDSSALTGSEPSQVAEAAEPLPSLSPDLSEMPSVESLKPWTGWDGEDSDESWKADQEPPALFSETVDVAAVAGEVLTDDRDLTADHGAVDTSAGASATDQRSEVGPAIDPEILDVFLEEAAEVLAAIGKHLAAVRRDLQDGGAARELRRACHTMKGAANVVGFSTIGRVCKAMEDLLDAFAEAQLDLTLPTVEYLERAYAVAAALSQDPSIGAGMLDVDALIDAGESLSVCVGVADADGAVEGEEGGDAAWAAAVQTFLADAETDEQREAWEHIELEDGQPQPLAMRTEAESAEAADAEQLDELVAIFAVEAEEHVAGLSAAAIRIDIDPRDAEALAEALRALHTLKGASGALGLETISAFCHETESRLGQEPESGLAGVLFEAAEVLEESVKSLAEASHQTTDSFPERQEPPRVTSFPDRHDTATDTPAAQPTMVAAEQQTNHVEEPDDLSKGGTVRVELQRVDELLNMVGEVVLTRTNLEQRLERVSRASEELRLTVSRLRRVAQYLEDRYEVAELIQHEPERAKDGGFDELEMDRYTELHRVSREMTELAADAETTGDEIELALKDLDAVAARQSSLASDLQDRLMSVRLVPLSSIGARLHRTARSVALKQGKEVEFSIQGGTTELDKRVLEELGDILLHLIRNAIDHGIERPEARAETGKQAAGKLALRVFREGSEAVLQLSDDGAGIDLRRLRQRGELAGLLPSGQSIDDQELVELIFAAGVSTSQSLGEISGRGVGLDAVKSAVRRLKGVIEVTTEVGRGTTFTLRLPVVLAVLQAMLVRADQHPYAIPMAAIERVVRNSIRPDGEHGRNATLDVDGESLGYWDLARVLGLPAGHRTEAGSAVLVVRTGERKVALAVEELLGQEEVVVKSLGPHLRSVQGVLGATVLGNGRVVPVLNTAELLTRRARVLGVRRIEPVIELPREEGPSALVVDDSLSVRKVLARLLERDGWKVREARDGVDALEVLQSFRPSVVLMDIEMPRMDGFEVASVLRDSDEYGHPPIVMVTSRGGDKHRRHAEELGVVGYVVKPYQEQELLALLHQVSAAAGQHRAA